MGFRQQLPAATAEGVAMRVTGREEVVVNIPGSRTISLPIGFQLARGGGRKGKTVQGPKDYGRKSGGSCKPTPQTGTTPDGREDILDVEKDNLTGGKQGE